MWKTEYRCVECLHPMSYNIKMGSRGRCPHCGHKAPSACTIVKTTEHAYRVVCIGDKKWWQFWKKRTCYREYK